MDMAMLRLTSKTAFLLQVGTTYARILLVEGWRKNVSTHLALAIFKGFLALLVYLSIVDFLIYTICLLNLCNFLSLEWLASFNSLSLLIIIKIFEKTWLNYLNQFV